MTLEDLIAACGRHPIAVVVFFACPVAGAFLLGRLHPRGKGHVSPWKYLYSLILHWTVLPGVLACLLIGYRVFFLRGNLLQLNILLYFLPVAAMAATLAVVRPRVNTKRIPGFGKLSSMVTGAAIAFLLALIIYKTALRILFFGSFWSFLGLAILLYVLLRVSMNAAMGRR